MSDLLALPPGLATPAAVAPTAAGGVLSPAAYTAKRAPLARRPTAHSDAPPPDLRAEPVYEALDLTFAELIELYFAANPCTHLAGSFRKWIGLFQVGDLSAWALTPERLKAGAEYLRDVKGYADSTINRELSLLGTIYRWIIAAKHAPVGFKSPTRGVDCGRVDEQIRRVAPPKPGEWQRMRLAARGFKDQLFTAFVWLAMDTGARRGELSPRLWTDLNFDEPEGPNLVVFDTKTKVPRRLYFSHETAALLKRLRPGAEKYRDQLIFKSKRGVAPNQYRKPWARLCQKIGRPGLHLHDIRHMLAADLLNAGKGMIPVANLLGHSTLVLKTRYGHLDDASVRKVQAERLGFDTPIVEFEPVRQARERQAERQAAAERAPMAELERLALVAQDAAQAAANAAAALAAAQAAVRAAMAPPAPPVVERLG